MTREREERAAHILVALLATISERGLPITGDGRINTTVLALLLNVREGTVRNWRNAGKGPLWVKLGGRVFYYLDEVARWLAEGQVDPFA